MQDFWVRSLGPEDPLEKGTATHSSVLPWRIPQREEPGRRYSPWGHKESDTTKEHFYFIEAAHILRAKSGATQLTPRAALSISVLGCHSSELYPSICVLSQFILSIH